MHRHPEQPRPCTARGRSSSPHCSVGGHSSPAAASVSKVLRPLTASHYKSCAGPCRAKGNSRLCPRPTTFSQSSVSAHLPLRPKMNVRVPRELSEHWLYVGFDAASLPKVKGKRLSRSLNSQRVFPTKPHTGPLTFASGLASFSASGKLA